MRRKENFLPVFFIFLILSVFLIFFSRIGFLNKPKSLLERVFLPFQYATRNIFTSTISDNSYIDEVKNENIKLSKELAKQKKLQEENSALLDQFQTSSPKSNTLLPAKIVGSPGFIPAVSDPTSFIIDKGKNDNARVGDAVVFRDNLVGEISKTSQSLSKVTLITDTSSSFTAKVINSSVFGVIRGEGGKHMILDNVLLSQNLKTSDIVVSKGDMDITGRGYPPDLIVGKIVSIEKKPSALFQKAEVESLLDFSKLSTLFVIVGVSR